MTGSVTATRPRRCAIISRAPGRRCVRPRASRRTTSSELKARGSVSTRHAGSWFACEHDGLLALPDWSAPLLQVLGEVLVHLEHGHALFAEHGPELVVRHDLAPGHREHQNTSVWARYAGLTGAP